MLTFRRKHLDSELESCIHLMRGRVLDIGGVKGKKRGEFTPPLVNVENWKYLNHVPSSNPDYCCSAENIPLEAESIDTVIMTEVLEYLKDPHCVFLEILRVLKGNGVALISIPLIHAIHGDWQEDRQRFTAIKLKEMIEAIGFQSAEIRTMGGLGSVIYDLIHAAGSYANKEIKPLSLNIFCKISKVAIPFFQWLDRMTMPGQSYITTGYFIVLRKGR